MSPTIPQASDWNQLDQTIFKDIKATPDALEIERATRSLFGDLQTVEKTFGYESESPMDRAARRFAEEVQRELESWEPRRTPDTPKLADTLHTPGGGSTDSNTSTSSNTSTNTDTPTIDDTAWTTDRPKTDGPKDVPAKGAETAGFDADQIKRTQKALAKGLPALASGIREAIK